MVGRVRRRRIIAIGVAVTAAASQFAIGGRALAQNSYCGPPADTVPPQITGVTLSSSAVDLTDGPQAITISVTATDTAATTASGVKFIRVEADGPRDERRVDLAMSSGTDTNGVWTGVIKLPERTISGNWYLRLFEIEDRAHNGVYYINDGKHPGDPYDPRLQPDWQQTFTVSGTPTAPSRNPGRPAKFRLTPGSVNTTHHAKTIDAKLVMSGPPPRAVQVDLRGHVDGGRRFFERTKLARHGRHHWTAGIPIRKWAGDSRAHVLLVVRYHHDVRPDYRFFYARQLRARKLASAVTLRSRHDTVQPVLSDLSFTPSVDTTTGPQTVHVTATPTDGQSGVAGVDVRFFLRSHGTNVVEGDPFARLTKHGHVWTGDVTIPGCVTAGDWEPGVYVFDNSGRHGDYERKKLTAAGLPADLAVTSSPTRDIEAPEIDSGTASGADHSITLNFSEGVENVTPSTLTVYAKKPAADRFHDSLTISGITCADGSSPVGCTSGLATSAVLDVPALVGGAKYEVWANLHDVTSQLTDAAGNPIDPEYGPDVTVTGA